MKKQDLLAILLLILLFLPFFIFQPLYDAFIWANVNHGYLAAFVKFAVLATFGEAIGLRIREGVYSKPGFGFLPRAFVWGFLGMSIKAAFVIFAGAAPAMLGSMGILEPTGPPQDILRQPDFSWIKLATAFTASTMMNIYFAPVFMTAHKITDIHIGDTGGTMRGFFSRIDVGKNFSRIDWKTMWNFIFKKTIVFFWIPAQTINFMLPEEFRILVAAILSIVLGVLLSLASVKHKKHDTAHSDVQNKGVSLS